MGDTSAIRAGRAFVEIFADTKQLDAAFKRVSDKLKALGTMVAGWGKAMFAAGTAILGSMVGIAKSASSLGDEFYNMSKRTGASVEALSELSYAASQTGTDIESFETGIKKMQKTLEQAAGGSAEANHALHDLGLTAEDLRGLSPDEQFKKIATAIAGIASPSQRAAVAMEIFGKQGTQLLPMLAEGAAGIDALQARARELGLTMSTEAARAANAFNDKLSELWQVIRKAGFDIGSILLPPLTSFVNLVEKVVVGAVQWLTANKDLVMWSLALGAVLAVAGATLYVFGTALVWGVGVMTAVGSALSAVMGIITGIGAAIGAVLTSPVLGAIAAIGVLGATMVWASGAGGKALSWLGEQFNALKGFAMDSFHGIADALQAGDIQLAAKILWKTLEVAWRTGVNTLEDIWGRIKLSFVQVVYGAIDGARAAWSIFTNFLTTSWINAVAALKATWITFKSWYQTAVNGTSNVFAKWMIDFDVLRGKITREQGEQQKADIDKMSAGDQTTTDTTTAAAQKAVQDQAAKEQKSSQDQSDADLAKYGGNYDDAVDSQNEENDRTTAANNKELESLRKELADLNGKAKDAKNLAASGIPGAGAPPGMPDVLPGINAAEKSTFGTFSAAAANRSGATGAVFDRIAKAVEETAKHTEEMKRNMGQGSIFSNG